MEESTPTPELTPEQLAAVEKRIDRLEELAAELLRSIRQLAIDEGIELGGES